MRQDKSRHDTTRHDTLLSLTRIDALEHVDAERWNLNKFFKTVLDEETHVMAEILCEETALSHVDESRVGEEEQLCVCVCECVCT